MTLFFLIIFTLSIRFLATTTGFFLSNSVFFTALCKAFLRRTEVRVILATQDILNCSQFTVKILLCLAESHTRMLLHEPFCAHSTLDIDLRLSAHDNKQKPHYKSPAQRKCKQVIGWLHNLLHVQSPLETYDERE